MTQSTSDSWFQIIFSTITLVSFVVTAFCAASLRSHIDEEKLRAEPSISKIFAGQIPPERVLTKTGKRRVKIAKIGILVFVLCVAVIIVKTQILG